MQISQKTFISSTYWTDKLGPAAALATIKKHRKAHVSEHLIAIGELVQAGWKRLAKKHSIEMSVEGIPPLSHWYIEIPESRLLHTLIVQKMLERGFLTSKAFYATYAHAATHVDQYLSALDDVLEELVPYICDEKLGHIFTGEPAHAGFKRLT